MSLSQEQEMGETQTPLCFSFNELRRWGVQEYLGRELQAGENQPTVKKTHTHSYMQKNAQNVTMYKNKLKTVSNLIKT